MFTLKNWIKSLSLYKDKHYESNGERGVYLLDIHVFAYHIIVIAVHTVTEAVV